MLKANYPVPTTNPPLQLGGTLANCFLSGSEIVFASIFANATNQSISFYSWDPDQTRWFPFPVPAVAAIAGTPIMQRYVTGKDPQGAYFCFVTSGTGEGVDTNISIRLADGGN